MSALLVLVAWVLAGHLVLSLAGQNRARGRWEWLLSAALAGLVVDLALALAAIRLLGPLPVGGGRLLLVLPALGGAVLLLRRGAGPRLEARPESGGRLGRTMLALLVLLVLVTAAGAPVHLFDPTFHFAYKGRVLFHEGFSASAFGDLEGHLGRVMTHPSYPPGLGLIHVLASWVDGAFSPHLARPLLALFALAPAAWLHASLRHRGPAAARMAALLWLSLPILYYLRLPHDDLSRAATGLLVGSDRAEAWLGGVPWFRADGPSLDGGGDLPLAAFLCGAAVHLWRLVGLGPARVAAADRADVALVLLCAAGMLLVKNEGLALLAVLALGLVLAAGLTRLLGGGIPGRGLALGLGALALGLVPVLPWLTFQGQIPTVDESYPERLTAERLEKAFTEKRFNDTNVRLATPARFVADEFARTLTHPLTWNFLWFAFAGALGVALLRPRHAAASGALLPLLVVLGGLALFYLILMVTPWQLGRLFDTGIPDRLFLQVAPLAVLAVALVAFGPGDEPQAAEEPRP